MDKILQKIILEHHLKKISAYNQVVLINAAGYNNIGDDLMAMFLKNELHKKNKELKIFNVCDLSNGKIPENIRKLGLSPVDAETAEKMSRDGTAVIFGGGTLFNAEVFKREDFLIAANNYVYLGFDVFLIGVEITSVIDTETAFNLFGKTKCNLVRNVESAQIIKRINPNAKVLVISDIVEHIPFIKKGPIGEQIVGINISRKSGIEKASLLRLINYISNFPHKVSLFSMCGHPTNVEENDSSFAEELKEELKDDDNVTVQPEFSTIEDIERYFSNTNLVITSRLHASIIAHNMRIPIINVSNEKKCINYSKHFSIPNISPTAENMISEVSQIVDRAISQGKIKQEEVYSKKEMRKVVTDLIMRKPNLVSPPLNEVPGYVYSISSQTETMLFKLLSKFSLANSSFRINHPNLAKNTSLLISMMPRELRHHKGIPLIYFYNKNQKEFVRYLFISLLLREPSEDDYHHYQNILNRLEISRLEIIYAIVTSPEGKKHRVYVIGLGFFYKLYIILFHKIPLVSKLLKNFVFYLKLVAFLRNIPSSLVNQENTIYYLNKKIADNG